MSLDERLCHRAAFGADGELQTVVFEHDVLCRAAECLVEDSGRVFLRLFDGLSLFLLLCLALFGGFLLLRSQFLCLFLLSLDLFFRGFVPPAEADKHSCDEYKSDDCIFIHFLF